MSDTINISLSIIISGVGVIGSCGVAYGMIKAALTNLTSAIKSLKEEFSADLKEVQSDLKEAKVDLGKVKDKVNDCERSVALVAQELSFRGGHTFKSRS